MLGTTLTYQPNNKIKITCNNKHVIISQIVIASVVSQYFDRVRHTEIESETGSTSFYDVNFFTMAEILNLGLFYLDKAVTNLGYQRKDGENFTPTEITENVKVKTVEIMALSGSRFFVRLGGLSGAVAVSMAAYGAHGK